MSITVILPDNKRLSIKVNINTLLSEILEKVCTNKGLDSNGYSLHRNNRCLDLSLTLRLASIPLNSELNLVHDEKKKNCDQKVTISIQYQDRQRKMGEFTPNDTMMNIIETLFGEECPEIGNDNIILSINIMNRKFEGRDVLEKTTLKLVGIYSGRVALRMNSRSIESDNSQKFVENIQFKKPESKPVKPATNVEQPTESISKTVLPSKSIPSTEEQEKMEINEPEPKPGSSKESEAPNSDVSYVTKKFVNENPIYKALRKDTKQESKEPIVFANLTKGKRPSVDPIPDNNDSSIIPSNISLTKENVDNGGVIPLDGNNEEILYSFKDSQFVEENVPENFYNHTTRDLHYILAQLHRQQVGNTEASLETKQIKEANLRKEQEKYKQTIIRIIFPYDRLILQAIFKPTDTIGDLINVVLKYTNQSDIFLFTTPPKTILSNELRLIDLQLVPNGSMYCGSKVCQQTLIKEEFKTNKISTFEGALNFAALKMRSIYLNSKEN